MSIRNVQGRGVSMSTPSIKLLVACESWFHPLTSDDVLKKTIRRDPRGRYDLVKLLNLSH